MSELLSRDFLQSLGVILDDDTYASLSEHLEDTLDQRVIEEIVDELDEEQLRELTTLRSGSSEVLRQWLVVNVPQLDAIIQDEVAILLGDVAERSGEI